MLPPRWKKFINYINVFWRDCVPTGSWEKNCYEASVNPEFGSTLARRLNQSYFPAVLQSHKITIKFGTAEARRLNWALVPHAHQIRMRFDERDNKKRKYWISKWKNTHSIRELIFLVLIISPTLELLNQCECGRSCWWRQYHQCVGDVSHTKKGANCKAQIWQLLDVFYYLVSLDCFSRIYMKKYGFLCLAVQYNLRSMVIFWNKVKEVKE